MTIAVKLILPFLICSFKTGATLPFQFSITFSSCSVGLYALVWVCRVDNYGIL